MEIPMNEVVLPRWLATLARHAHSSAHLEAHRQKSSHADVRNLPPDVSLIGHVAWSQRMSSNQKTTSRNIYLRSVRPEEFHPGAFLPGCSPIPEAGLAAGISLLPKI
eukprot:753069-Hanusia_phi.AAC.3